MTIKQAHDLANEGQGEWSLVGFIGDYSSMSSDAGLSRIRHAMANAGGPTEEHPFGSEAIVKPETRVIRICGDYGYEAILVRNDHPYLQECGDALPGYMSPVESGILQSVERELRLQFLEDWSPFRMGYENIHKAWVRLPSSIKDEIVTKSIDFVNPSSGVEDETYWIFNPAGADIIGEDNYRFLGELARVMRERRHESHDLTHEPFVASVVSDAHGQYQPQIFAEMVKSQSFNGSWHYIDESTIVELLDGPENPWYWDAWETVSQNARFFHEGGQEFRIDDSSDIFLVDSHATESDLKPFYG